MTDVILYGNDGSTHGIPAHEFCLSVEHALKCGWSPCYGEGKYDPDREGVGYSDGPPARVSAVDAALLADFLTAFPNDMGIPLRRVVAGRVVIVNEDQEFIDFCYGSGGFIGPDWMAKLPYQEGG